MAFDPLVIRPGDLRHNVSINAPSTTRDVAGQLNATWTTILSTWAKIEGTSSLTFKYSFQNNALASNATDCITIRYPYSDSTPLDITPGMQVTWGDQIYTIQAVDDVLRRHRVIHLACVGIGTGSS